MVDGDLGGQLEDRVVAQFQVGEQMALHQVPGLVEEHELHAVQAESDEEVRVEEQQAGAVARGDHGRRVHRGGRDLVRALRVQPGRHRRLRQSEVQQRGLLQPPRLGDRRRVRRAIPLQRPAVGQIHHRGTPTPLPVRHVTPPNRSSPQCLHWYQAALTSGQGITLCPQGRGRSAEAGAPVSRTGARWFESSRPAPCRFRSPAQATAPAVTTSSTAFPWKVSISCASTDQASSLPAKCSRTSGRRASSASDTRAGNSR